MITAPFFRIKQVNYDLFRNYLADIKPMLYRIPYTTELDINYLLNFSQDSSLWEYSYFLFTRNNHLAAVVIAREQEKCFGFPERAVFIEFLAVLEKYEKRRYAVRLLEYIFAKAFAMEINKIFLTVDPANIKAINRYRKMGFRTMHDVIITLDELRKKGAENATVMLKNIVIQMEDLDKVLPF
jgi:ribosomal protein S18 acetylase RimI-like enzyme